MNNPEIDLTAYALGDSSPAEREAAAALLAASPEAQEEFERLQYTLTALHSLGEEEVPRRLAFISDPVFEAPWWQRLVGSGPRLGFAAASLLAVAIIAHGYFTRPLPVVAQAPVLASQISQVDVDSAVDRAVAKAIQQVEARQQKQLNVALTDLEKRHSLETQMMAVGFRENLDLVRKQLNMVYVSNARLTVGGTE